MEKLTAEHFIEIKSSAGTKAIVGKHSTNFDFECKAGETISIKYPVKPTTVQWTGSLHVTHDHHDKFNSLEGFSTMHDLTQHSIVRVWAETDHVLFQDAAGNLYGMGKRA